MKRWACRTQLWKGSFDTQRRHGPTLLEYQVHTHETPGQSRRTPCFAGGKELLQQDTDIAEGVICRLRTLDVPQQPTATFSKLAK